MDAHTEFLEDEIVLTDHTSVSKLKYSNIKKIKEKNNIVNYQSNQEFEFDTIDLDFLTSPKLYIRYGASGNYNDDWYNKNVKVRIQFLRE